VCANERSHGSARGAPGNRRPYRDSDLQHYFTQLLLNLPQARRSELPTWLPDRWKLHQAARIASLQDAASSAS